MTLAFNQFQTAFLVVWYSPFPGWPICNSSSKSLHAKLTFAENFPSMVLSLLAITLIGQGEFVAVPLTAFADKQLAMLIAVLRVSC